MTRFRPCIDLHAGQVKQIVGGTLTSSSSDLTTNYVSTLPAAYYANLYREHSLHGGHVIMLGAGNEEAAREALAAWPGGMQVGGGISDKNAAQWVEYGASQVCQAVDMGKVIITSFLFPSGRYAKPRLDAVLAVLGHDKGKLVIDLSCRRKGDTYYVATDKWQMITDFEITRENIALLEPHCSEFLIHAADSEGLQKGIDEELVRRLAAWCTIPVTYAGGGRTIEDLDNVKRISGGKVDITIGSALDIFGGKGVTFEESVAWNNAQEGSDRDKKRK